MRIKSLILLLGVWVPSLLQAQEFNLPNKAEKEWFDIRAKAGVRHYSVVIQNLEPFVERYPQFIPAQKLLAESYMSTGAYQKTIELIGKIFPNEKYPEKDWLAMKADAHKELKQYGEAISAWQQFREWPALGLSYQKLVDEKIAQLKFTKQAVDNPVPYNPISVGTQVNTEFFELYPYISPDGTRMYFTRKERQEDIFEAESINDGWANVHPLSFNTMENEGAHTVSADGRFLFFTACNRRDGLGSCDIFYSLKTNDGWTNPAGIGAPVNSTDWESQPCFTANNSAILFSSNRPNGYGGKDLYIAYLDKNFRWKEPINLGPEINTKGNEETPFLHADGKTLYFSSNGHPSVGGKDLFISRLGADGKWSKPVNLGYPINTEGDETGLFVALDGKSAYLASDREGGVGNLDIYSFELNKPMRATPSTYVKARIKNKQDNQPVVAEYRIALLQNNETFAEGVSSSAGEFIICIPTDTTYALTIDKPGFLFHSDQFEPKDGTLIAPYMLDVFLEPVRQGSSTVLKNVLFAYNSHALLPTSYPELDKLADLMLSNPNITAEVSGHTDNIGSDSYNLELSRKRAESVVDYLTAKGVSKTRLTAKGYGSGKPIADNATDEGRAQNRRTEFSIISQ